MLRTNHHNKKDIVLLEHAVGVYGFWLANALEKVGIRRRSELIRYFEGKCSHSQTIVTLIQGENTMGILNDTRDMIVDMTGDADGEADAYERNFDATSYRVIRGTDPVEALLPEKSNHYQQWIIQRMHLAGLDTVGDVRKTDFAGLGYKSLERIVKGDFPSVSKTSRHRIGSFFGDLAGEAEAYDESVRLGELQPSGSRPGRKLAADLRRERAERISREPENDRTDWWTRKAESLLSGRGNRNHDLCPRCGHEFDEDFGYCAACGKRYIV